jgi:hypothetical protein
MSEPRVFVATLGFLTYRLLFHSERQLTVVSLIFCLSCAWCIEQLIVAGLEDAGKVSHVPVGWQASLSSARALAAMWIRPLCTYGPLSDYSRLKCAGFLDLLQGSCAEDSASGAGAGGGAGAASGSAS